MFQLKWVWENMKGYRKRYILALLLTVVLAFMQLINPTIVQRVIDDVVMKIPTATNIEPFITLLFGLSALIIVFTLVRTSLGYLSLIIYETCGQKFLFKLKADLYVNLQKQDSHFFSTNRTGDIMTRLTGDLEMVRHTICFVIRNFVDCFFLFLATCMYMFSKDVIFTLSLLVVTPFLFLTIRSFSKKVRPLYVDLRERLSSLNSNTQENISGNKVVKAFAREEYENRKFNEKNNDFKNANLKATMMWLKYYPLIEGLSQSLFVAVLLMGGIAMMQGRISGGVFMAFNSLCWLLIHPMRMIGMLLNDLERFFVCANKVIELCNTETHIKTETDSAKPADTMKGDIQFKDVVVELNSTIVLDTINLDIKAGQTIAIMGSTGSGKTTLINCIARFLDIKSGSLTIDGVEVKKYDLQFLRANIGIASQDVFLFSDTIEGNIAYGDINLSNEDVIKFANMASAEFIEKTESGFDTVVGERGMGLSGGQKQRIALARALAIRPKILILDDTTSAVDLETEKHIQDSLENLDFPCTKIIIAQRVSTTKSADKIIILDEGKIIEEGTHKELLAQNGYYADVFNLQNGESVETKDGL